MSSQDRHKNHVAPAAEGGEEDQGAHGGQEEEGGEAAGLLWENQNGS